MKPHIRILVLSLVFLSIIFVSNASSHAKAHHEKKLKRRFVQIPHKIPLHHRQAIPEYTTEPYYNDDSDEVPNPPQLLCTCPFDDEPTCGKNGWTYLHPCLASCAGVEVDHPGECTEDEDECDCANPETWEEEEPSPVCGEDGLTYEYFCLLQCENVELSYEGPCNVSSSEETESNSTLSEESLENSTEIGSAEGKSKEESSGEKSKKDSTDDKHKRDAAKENSKKGPVKRKAKKRTAKSKTHKRFTHKNEKKRSTAKAFNDELIEIGLNHWNIVVSN